MTRTPGIAMDPVFRVTKDDPEMVAAIRKARKTFRSFLREADADLRRAIPVLEDALVKLYIPTAADPEVGEHLWARYLGRQPEHEGRYLALLLSAPRKVRGMKKGDHIDFSTRSLSDWLYVTDGRAHGAFTVQVLRARMSQAQRKKHDAGYPFSFE